MNILNIIVYFIFLIFEFGDQMYQFIVIVVFGLFFLLWNEIFRKFLLIEIFGCLDLNIVDNLQCVKYIFFYVCMKMKNIWVLFKNYVDFLNREKI